MDGSKSCVTAAGGKDVWLRAGGELCEAAKDVVANSSVVLSVWLFGIVLIERKLTVT